MIERTNSQFLVSIFIQKGVIVNILVILLIMQILVTLFDII